MRACFFQGHHGSSGDIINDRRNILGSTHQNVNDGVERKRAEKQGREEASR